MKPPKVVYDRTGWTAGYQDGWRSADPPPNPTRRYSRGYSAAVFDRLVTRPAVIRRRRVAATFRRGLGGLLDRSRNYGRKNDGGSDELTKQLTQLTEGTQQR